MTPDADRVGGNMVEVVRNTSQADRRRPPAIAAYIKSLPAVEGRKPAAEEAEIIALADMPLRRCAGCYKRRR